MSDQTLACVNRESEFALEELFFSTTDKRGVIRFGNAVFTRVSGYKESELLGFAHSKVRHPDMPRSVFRLLWDTIEAGETIAAYVKNRAKDGTYYWVMAVIAPIADGYLSVRLKPSSHLMPIIEQAYASVLQQEQEAAAEGLGKTEIAEVGLVPLMAAVKSLGFDDYSSFMRYALVTEMTSRHQNLERNIGSSNRVFNEPLETQSRYSSNDLLKLSQQRDRVLALMLDQLATLRTANTSFLETGRVMVTLSTSISLAATNARIAATTYTLEAIARALAESEGENRTAIELMSSSIATLASSLDHLAFEVSVAALKGEVCTKFLSELETGAADSTVIRENITLLLEQSELRFHKLMDRLSSTSDWFKQLNEHTERVNRNIKSLRFIRMAGMKEASNLALEHSFRTLLEGVKGTITETLEQCSNLRYQVRHSEKAIGALNQSKTRLSDVMDHVGTCQQSLRGNAVFA